MIWPAAALAIFLIGFVVVYGTAVQSRLQVGPTRRALEDAAPETDTV
jgi:hypothetical protein